MVTQGCIPPKSAPIIIIIINSTGGHKPNNNNKVLILPCQIQEGGRKRGPWCFEGGGQKVSDPRFSHFVAPPSLN